MEVEEILMMVIKKKLLLVTSFLLFLKGCHPFSLFAPPKLKPPNFKIENVSSDTVEVLVDRYGIPYIKATSMLHAMYALGYMHARDRLFQLDVMRHAAKGRLSELFGERGLEYDQKFRILTYKLDEQIKNLSSEDISIINSYCRGVNQSALDRGKSIEHFLLNTSFEKFNISDAIAIARLQAWGLASDLELEISRLRIMRSSASHEVKALLLKGTDDQKSAIIKSKRSNNNLITWPWPAYLESLPKTKIFEKFDDEHSKGASNAWAVMSHLTDQRHAMLMNDPHLVHSWPSAFYLAVIFVPEGYLAGASFVGLPAIVIGSSKSLSFGVTASYVNTQDTVLLKNSLNRGDSYMLDDEEIALRPWPQRFCLGKNTKAKCIEKIYYLSEFGPVIDQNFKKTLAFDERLALMWTGFLVDHHKNIVKPFLNLASAKTVSEGVQIAKSMTLPCVNMLFADSQGQIGFSYAGLIPVRAKNQHPYTPLDGSTFKSHWSQVLPSEEIPSVINPKEGFLINANQNIFELEENYPPSKAFGTMGKDPYRAIRIREIIERLLKEKNTVTEHDLKLIQSDAHSVMARTLAPLLGRQCLHTLSDSSDLAKRFAEEIKAFNGDYDLNSYGALPFEILMEEITKKALIDSLKDEELAKNFSKSSSISYIVNRSIYKSLEEYFKSPITPNALKLLSDSCGSAFQRLKKEFGESPKKWRWGQHHYLELSGLLSKVFLVGKFFRDQKQEISGHSSAPKAESGLPVDHGSVLRFSSVMSDPPKLMMILDGGNSGSVADRNGFDQSRLWNRGEMIEFFTSWPEKENSIIGRLYLTARPLIPQ